MTWICDGCNVRGVFEHKCWGESSPRPCECDDALCRQRQGHEVDWDAELAKAGIERG